MRPFTPACYQRPGAIRMVERPGDELVRGQAGRDQGVHTATLSTRPADRTRYCVTGGGGSNVLPVPGGGCTCATFSVMDTMS